jgi:hypothetical protein
MAWISISGAVKVLAERKRISLGRAKAELIEACHAGLIQNRWRGHYAGFCPQIARQQWLGADIDISANRVTLADDTPRAFVDLDTTDFEAWLAEQSPQPKGRRFANDDELVAEGKRGIGANKYNNAHHAAQALASRAQGQSESAKIARLRKKIQAALKAS